MFKEPRLVEGKQDVYCRKVFVVAPKESLISHFIEQNPAVAGFKEALYRPSVYFTPEVPFESELEGSGPALKRIIRRSFLEDYVGNTDDELPSIDLDYDVSMDDKQVRELFERWWTIREADDYSEFEASSWH